MGIYKKLEERGKKTKIQVGLENTKL